MLQRKKREWKILPPYGKDWPVMRRIRIGRGVAAPKQDRLLPSFRSVFPHAVYRSYCISNSADVKKGEAHGAPSPDRKRSSGRVAVDPCWKGIVKQCASSGTGITGPSKQGTEGKNGGPPLFKRSMILPKTKASPRTQFAATMELMIRFELTTSSLPMTCSTY